LRAARFPAFTAAKRQDWDTDVKNLIGCFRVNELPVEPVRAIITVSVGVDDGETLNEEMTFRLWEPHGSGGGQKFGSGDFSITVSDKGLRYTATVPLEFRDEPPAEKRGKLELARVQSVHLFDFQATCFGIWGMLFEFSSDGRSYPLRFSVWPRPLQPEKKAGHRERL